MSVAVPAPTSHRHPLRAPGVARLLALSMVARTPEAAIGLLFILRVRDLGGSFALAGLVSAVLGVGLAAGAPVLGRLIDRRGQTGVLTVTATIATVSLALAGMLPHGADPALLLALAFVTGLFAPPIAPCLRALFGRNLHGDERHGALALDAALQEISFMLGPLVFVTALAAVSPKLGLLGAAGALLAGTLAFAASPESRHVPADASTRPRGGAIAVPGIRTLLLVAAGMGGAYGATEVALAGAADHVHSNAALGILLAVWSIPSLAAGLISAHRGEPGDQARALVLLTAATALPTAALALMPDLWTLGLMLGASGAIAAPMFATLYSLVGRVAAPGTTTEAFTWLGSGLFAGLAAGGAVGGILISSSGVAAAFIAAGAFAALAAGLASVGANTLRPTAVVRSASLRDAEVTTA
jgi:MFS family permease